MTVRVRWVFVLLLAVAGAFPAYAQKQDAREVKARELFAVGKYAEALDVYVRLYAETTHPTYMRNIGRCYQNLGEPDKAISSFREYLRQARDLAPEHRTQVEGYIREMEELKRRREAPPGSTPPPGAATTMPPPAPAGAVPASPPLNAAPAPVLGTPGTSVPLVAGAPADLGPGVLVPMNPGTSVGRTDGRTGRTAAFVVGGLGVGALAVGAVFGVRAFSKRHASDLKCPKDVTGVEDCKPEGVTLNEEAKTAARVSDIAVGAGLVGLAVATYLFVRASGHDAPAATPQARDVHLSPGIGRGEARLTLEGSW